MNFSAEIISQKLAVYMQLRSLLVSELERIDTLIQQLQWENIEDDSGEIVSFADYSNFWAMYKVTAFLIESTL